MYVRTAMGMFLRTNTGAHMTTTLAWLIGGGLLVAALFGHFSSRQDDGRDSKKNG
jgi:hypothetical protein